MYFLRVFIISLKGKLEKAGLKSFTDTPVPTVLWGVPVKLFNPVKVANNNCTWWHIRIDICLPNWLNSCIWLDICYHVQLLLVTFHRHFPYLRYIGGCLWNFSTRLVSSFPFKEIINIKIHFSFYTTLRNF